MLQGLIHFAGSTSVLAAVYGPVEVKQSKEKPDRTVVEVIVKPATGIAGIRARILLFCLP
jgi:hypothetical protein